MIGVPPTIKAEFKPVPRLIPLKVLPATGVTFGRIIPLVVAEVPDPAKARLSAETVPPAEELLVMVLASALPDVLV